MFIFSQFDRSNNMSNGLIIAIFAGVGGMIGWGSADFFAKKTIDKIGPISSLVWAHLCGTLALIFLAVLQFLAFDKMIHIPTSFHEWSGLIFFGILQMVVYWFVYEGFGKGQLAVLNPVFASFSGLVALFSVLFLREVLSINLFLSLILIFGGVLFINLDVKGLKSKRLNIVPGLKEVGFATILAAFWTLGWDKFVTGNDFLSYALFMYLFMTIASVLLAKIKKVKLGGVKSSLWKYIILIGIGETIAYTAISFGYSSSPFTSVIALISGAFSLPTIVLARIFLKEKVSRIQTIGSLIIVVGIIVLAIF